PVTNAQFFNFVQKHPQWKRDQVSKIFADEHYLAHWQSSLQLGPKAQANQPVTYVSWFAAKAYCESLSKRLPKEEEWEFAASSSESEAYAQNDPIWKQRILDWYAKPSSSALPEVKKQAPNFWKVYDLHGLVWEWVGDFNSSLVSSDSREGTDQKTRFCGSGGLKATDKEDYASFMRMAFRSSLRANYTTKNLGFRCAQ
ncbi:MAG: formylglycine-generating enzyme family protein, partial [Deltaproteobacteria bacterium]|nr:formylglycine-generating enzyme family protein [Deltaproteobacteria bacterium]